MRAKRQDANHREIVEALEAYGCLVQTLHTVGDGCPDLVIGINGRLGFVEIKDGAKSPSSRKLTEDQIKFWNRWMGYPMCIVTDIEGALRFAKLLDGAS